ncbi:MAG: hypothetical protein H6713_00735 [Myxococcales bacterium]|nr:hypothetical protein [Myxococcales bacterium]
MPRSFTRDARARAVPIVALALALAGCRANTPSAPESAPRPSPRGPTSLSRAPEPARCETAACWRERAEEARRRGVDDVAAAHLERAHRAQPDRGASPRGSTRSMPQVSARGRAGAIADRRAQLDERAPMLTS